MKMAWAIICSLMLAVTPALLAQAPSPACAQQPMRACCHPGHIMPCCQGKPSNSQPVPNVPPSGNQTQISLLFANAFVVCVLPDATTPQFSSAVALPLTATGSPLYTRNCALLI